MSGTVMLEASWKAALAGELSSPSMAELRSFLKAEIDAGKQVFPSEPNYFAALALTPLDKVKVVILGQDPYHGEGQAHGLCFSVQPGVRVPPSLKNIYKELEADLGIVPAKHGNLESWARQGVLLLNAVLTVERGLAASHRGRGWESFTDAVIGKVNALAHPVVFLLWGSHAQKKAAFVDTSRHLVLKAPHPSPLSAHTGFLGCRHFSQANAFLEKNGLAPIDWRLPGTA
ncbi:MAG: uracil-DNA glycosylase [Hoeflea sp.]|uniref:uracil-DNA glycosylase n=1 Tax=Hoeflea sp. TaxID=1940281 RepID=UPI00272FFF9A|nr:uracil-DNA glycosylase [Hoeflea sp.]MDP2121813.1 uracil-DNA glycosylase [Hoeflea sp.]